MSKENCVHNDCPLVRGVKLIECDLCGEKSLNYSNGETICLECAKKFGFCRICGYPLSEEKHG